MLKKCSCAGPGGVTVVLSDFSPQLQPGTLNHHGLLKMLTLVEETDFPVFSMHNRTA